MFNWNPKYHWEFSLAGYTDPDRGPAITGAKMFRGGKYLNTIRESAQNGADARLEDLPEDKPVRMEYELMNIHRTDIPGIERLADVIDLCFEYISSIPNAKTDDVQVLKNANDNHLKKQEFIQVLRIGDYNTVGLKDDRFDKLLKMEGITNKGDQDSGGSFGYGKFAPFLLSPVNTILYSTLTSDGDYLFQGRSLLSTFKDGEKRMQGNSLFGYIDEQKKTFDPVSNMEDVPEIFRRTESGTDLYVLCFEKTGDWIEQMAIYALENFFYSIHTNKLEFVFKDGEKEVIISKENLDEMMNYYNDVYEQNYNNEATFMKFTAPTYWKVLNDPRTIPEVDPDFRGKGEVKLYILMGEDIEGRTVLEMRSLGMKIQVDDAFKRLPPFNGVLIATGVGKEDEDYNGNISKFLLKMESPAHNSWLLEDVEIEDIKAEAKQVLNDLHTWIRKVVKLQLPPDDGKPIEVFGLSKILPGVVTPGNEKIEEDAIFKFRPQPVVVEPVKNKKKKNKISVPKAGREKGDGHGPKPGPDPKPIPTPRKKKKMVPVALRSKTNPYIASSKKYRISFIAAADADPLFLHVKISGDDSSVFESVVKSAWADDQKLIIQDGLILIPNVKRNTKVACEVLLDEKKRCALEVTAYVKK